MISVQHLHFGYPKKPVFRDLSLELQPGFIYGLLGKNGTGKSTLLRNIAGLLFPRQGSIRVMGFEPGKRLPAFLQEVFMVPEEFHMPDVPLEYLEKHYAPFYPRFSREQFRKYISEFNIPLEGSLQHMSYGQKKKVLISFGLAANTSLLLLDEPTNGLDIMSKSQFRKVMAGALDEKKCIIISTHQVKDLENLIDRITIIDEGSILFDQAIERIATKLAFKISNDTAEIKNSLYSESSLKGSAIVAVNTEGDESKIDLELLYKAIILNRQAVQSVFNA
jgi:ABC-2 type transport system ATP-binding protein